jgi:hypothetical protein
MLDVVVRAPKEMLHLMWRHSEPSALFLDLKHSRFKELRVIRRDAEFFVFRFAPENNELVRAVDALMCRADLFADPFSLRS